MADEAHVEAENGENPTKSKHRKSVFDNFNKLNHDQQKVRIKNSLSLLKQFTDPTNNEKNSDINYALGRLISGLGSSKNQTRIGYFTFLVGLLNLHSISITELLEIVEKKLHTAGGNSKSENADVSHGRILVAGAIFRTNLFENSDQKEKIKVVEMLLESAKKRNYLNLAAYSFLIDLYKKIKGKEFNKVILPLLKPDLTKPWPEQGLDSLFLLISTQKAFPQTVNDQFLAGTLGTNRILCEESLPQLSDALTTILRSKEVNHPVFEEIASKLAKSELVVPFFDHLDNHLARGNRNKFFVAIKLATHVINKMEDDFSKIPDLFTRNFMQVMLNTFKTNTGKLKDPEFQENITKLFAALLETLKNDAVKTKTKIKLLKKLIFWPGSFIFEKITQTKLIQNITLTLNVDGVKKLSEIYIEVMMAKKERKLNENNSEKWWNIDRVYASHLLAKLLNHSAMHNENEWKIEQLCFLAEVGLFQSEVGSELGDAFKETFYQSLELKLSKLEDLRTILMAIVGKINEKSLELSRAELGEAEIELWRKVVHICEKIQGKSKITKKTLVFQVLFLHLGLQLFNNVKLATDTLTELFACYERVSKEKADKKVEVSPGGDETDPAWIEVMIDLFLNLLSHNSSLIRNIIACVFTHLCKYITISVLHQILSVLDPKSDANPLEKFAESDSEPESGPESDSDDEDDNDDEDSEPETVNDKLKMALHEALKRQDSDAESLDLDALDEEKGEALDKALAAAFRQFKPNLGRKKGQSRDDQALTHFRVRALDLIDIYLGNQPSMAACLEVMLPLLQCLEFCVRDEHQGPLENRVRNTLKRLTTIKKFGDCEGVTEEVLVGLLTSLMERGTKNGAILTSIGDKMADCCVFVVNCVKMVDKKAKKSKLWRLIRDKLSEFFEKRDCLIPFILFKNIILMNTVGITHLYATLTGFVFNESVRPFRRYQAIELLRLFYGNRRLLDASRDEILEVIGNEQTHFLDACHQFCASFIGSERSLKVKLRFLTQMFGLIGAIKASKMAADYGAWSGLGESLRTVRSMVGLGQEGKSAWKKMCGALGVPSVVEMRGELVRLGNEDEEEEGEKKEKVKSAKRGNKEARMEKKAAKKLRLESLSNGLGSKRKVAVLGASQNGVSEGKRPRFEEED